MPERGGKGGKLSNKGRQERRSGEVTKPQIDKKVLQVSVSQAVSQPRLAFYSPVAAAVLNYLKNTQPRFSISSELARLVEADLARRYPLLVSHVKRALEAKGLRRRAKGSGAG
ncbi:MAG: hypothetical protein NYU90_02165 [Aigarchaeota archaeon]|nr:hypothetical protein [Candidatus Calditenuis fumarioli]